MIYEYKYKRNVEFPDTDMAGIMHFSNYLRFMECTELEMYKSLGLDLHRDDSVLPWGLPRVHAECDFLRPLKFSDVVEIQLLIRRIGSKSIAYDFKLRANGEDEVVAMGKLVVVVVSQKSISKNPLSIEIPKVLKDKITEAPKELLINGE